MTLDRPLLALVVGALALVVLYVLDRLRRRPVVLLVASLELFPKTAEVESQAESSEKRAWRDLVLRGLAAVALALAAGGPRLAQATSAGRRVQVLIDRSASMAAKDGGTTRLELARRELARVLDALAPEDLVQIHLDPPGDDEPLEPLSPAAARAFVPEIRSVPSTIAERGDLVAAAASARGLPLLVVTDRDVAFVPSDFVRVAVVGSPQRNVGITALASRRRADGVELLLVATSSRAEVDLEFQRGDAGREKRRLTIERSAIAPVPSGTESVRAKLVAEDALAGDDEAIALRREDAPLRVVVDPKLGEPLAAALRAVPGTAVRSGAERTGADVYVRRWEPSERREALHGFTIYFEPRGDERFEHLKPGSRADEFGDLRAIGIERGALSDGRGLTVEPVLVDGGDERIVIGIGPSVAWLGFEPPMDFKQGWAAQPSFPRFFAYLLERVRSLQPEDLVCHPTGKPLDVPRPADAKPDARLVVTDPRGRAHMVEKTFTPTEPGRHEVRAEGGAKSVGFAAALLDEATSDLSATRARPFGPGVLATFAQHAAAKKDATLAWLLALVALGLAGVAWSLESR